MVHWPGDSADKGLIRSKTMQDVVMHECPRTGAQIADWDFEAHVSQFSTKIDDKLYLGNNSNAKDLNQLRHKKDTITHILNIQRGGEAPYSEDGFKYEILDLDDLPAERLLDILTAAIEFIKDGVSGGKVLVHCDTGISRASSVVIAYLMKTQKLSYKKALSKVNSARKAMFQDAVKPNHGFVRQLRQFEKQITPKKR